MPVHKSREPMVEAIGESGIVRAGGFLVIQLPGDSIKIVRIIHNSTIGDGWSVPQNSEGRP